MGRCCGNRGRSTGSQPASTYVTDPRLPQGVSSIAPQSGNPTGPLIGQSKVCSRCAGPMRVLHQYSSGGVNIQAYSCMVCSHQEDVPLP